MIAAIGGLVPARWFWLAGLLAVVVSQAVIISAWSDARAGTLPNLVLAALVVYAACAWGPFGLRAEQSVWFARRCRSPCNATMRWSPTRRRCRCHCRSAGISVHWGSHPAPPRHSRPDDRSNQGIGSNRLDAVHRRTTQLLRSTAAISG